MKNIAVFGSARSGKTMLAKMIARERPKYQILSGDVLVGTFLRTMPQLRIDHKGGPGMQELFPEFLGLLYRRAIEYGVGEFSYILESCDITPEQAMKYFAADDVMMIFLVNSSLSATESLEQVRKYEHEGDWTKKRTDEELMEQLAHWVERSRDFERECKEREIWCVDTSRNRDETLRRVMEELDLGG